MSFFKSALYFSSCFEPIHCYLPPFLFIIMVKESQLSCNTNRNVQLSDFEKSRWKVLTNDLINDFWKAIGYVITVKSVLLNMSHRLGYTFNNLLQCTYNYTCTLTSQYIPCLNLFLHIHDLHNQNCKRRLISLIINNSTPILKLVGKSIHKNLTLRDKN